MPLENSPTTLDNVTKARVDIAALLLMNQVLTVAVAVLMDKNNTKSALVNIHDMINIGIDQTTFLDNTTANLWRSEMKKTVEAVMAPILKVEP